MSFDLFFQAEGYWSQDDFYRGGETHEAGKHVGEGFTLKKIVMLLTQVIGYEDNMRKVSWFPPDTPGVKEDIEDDEKLAGAVHYAIKTGESEENIRTLFFKAYRTAPSIVFIDEIDAIASKRDNQQKSMDTRIVTQLLSCMDEKYMLLKQKESQLSSGSSSKPGHVIVIGATNRPDALDPAFRRSLRFDEEICLDVPDEKAREEIFSLCTRHLSLDSTFDFAKIARLTSGFVALAKKAGIVASKEIVHSRKSQLSTDVDSLMSLPLTEEERKKLFFTTSHFEVR